MSSGILSYKTCVPAQQLPYQPVPGTGKRKNNFLYLNLGDVDAECCALCPSVPEYVTSWEWASKKQFALVDPDCERSCENDKEEVPVDHCLSVPNSCFPVCTPPLPGKAKRAKCTENNSSSSVSSTDSQSAWLDLCDENAAALKEQKRLKKKTAVNQQQQNRPCTTCH